MLTSQHEEPQDVDSDPGADSSAPPPPPPPPRRAASRAAARAAEKKIAAVTALEERYHDDHTERSESHSDREPEYVPPTAPTRRPAPAHSRRRASQTPRRAPTRTPAAKASRGPKKAPAFSFYFHGHFAQVLSLRRDGDNRLVLRNNGKPIATVVVWDENVTWERLQASPPPPAHSEE